MAERVAVYNAAKVAVIYGGAQLDGFADGSFVSIEPAADDVVSVSGADGEIALGVTNDNRHRVTVTLLQTSNSNDVLSGLATANKLAGGGVLLPLAVEDLSGRTLFLAPQAWIVRKPTQDFSKEVGNREWVIETGKPTVSNIGGN